MRKRKRWMAAFLAVILTINAVPGYVYAQNITSQEEVPGHNDVMQDEEETDAIGTQSVETGESTEIEKDTEDSSTEQMPTKEGESGGEKTEEIPGETIENDSTERVEILQQRIDALPFIDEWTELCEQQNEDYQSIYSEIEALCQEIEHTYGLDIQGEEFDPYQDYSEQCPLDLTKLLAILYPMEETLSLDQKITGFENDEAFGKMCQDIFGVSYSNIVTDDNYVEVYVGKNNGSEQTGTLGSVQKPFGSLNEAYTNLATNSQIKGAVIHLIDSYAEVQDEISIWPQMSVPVIIVSDAYETAYLHMSSNNWSFKDNTGFYQVKVSLDYDEGKAGTIFANGNTVVFGGYQKNNFEFLNSSDSRHYPTLFGAESASSGNANLHSSVENTTLKVYGGTWSQIFGGGEIFSDVTGTANVTIDGSYSTESGIQTGAVTFNDAHLSYMEGSSNIYGGGAGNLAGISASNAGNVNHAMLSVSYVTTKKSVTPCGGWMGESADLIMNYVEAQSVNARSEGISAGSVSFTINNCTINGNIGSLGNNLGGVNKKYITERLIQPFKITIENSTVRRIGLKDGNLGNTSYNNRVSNVSLIIRDSTVTDEISMGRLDADFSSDVVNLIELNNSSINRVGTGVNFSKIENITLNNIGTEAKPFVWKEFTFGGNYTDSNRRTNALTINNSYVDFQVRHTTTDMKILGNSKVIVEKNLLLLTKNYEGDRNSTLVLKDGASVKITGDVLGTGTMVSPELTGNDVSVTINWKRSENTHDLDYFKTTDTNIKEYKQFVPIMNVCKWTNYEIEMKNHIYVDGENGHDTVTEYADTSVTEEGLGHNPNYPVKTLKKAYELCNEKDESIVICGPYTVSLTEMENENKLINCINPKPFVVTITGQDEMTNYSDQAGFEFQGEMSSGRVDLDAELIFENLNMITNVSNNGIVRIFSNGYTTKYGDGISVTRQNDSSLNLYGGAYKKGVLSTNLTVNVAEASVISAGGYGDGCFVGDSDNTDNSKIVAKLTAVFDRNSKPIDRVVYYGNAYGSVEQDLTYWKNLSANTQINYNSNSGTIYGDFHTKVSGASSDGNTGNLVARLSPTNQTVKGKITFEDNGQVSYSDLQLESGTYNEVEADIRSYANNVLLFGQKTNAKSVIWKMAGTVNNIYGSDNNSQLKSGTMLLNVELNSTGNTLIRCGSTMNSEGYSEYTNTNITLKNFNKSIVLTRLRGFGAVTLDNCQCTVEDNISTTNLTIQNDSNVTFKGKMTIGKEATKKGSLSILSNGCLKLNNAFILEGSLRGEENSERAGQMINNIANENNETEMLVVNGTMQGNVIYGTDYEKASIQVSEPTIGSEFETMKGMTISCEPGSGAGEHPNRIWTVNNTISNKIIFVNGTLKKDSDGYEEHDGHRPETAFATLEEAYEAVLNKGEIVICGNTTVSKWPDTSKEVTITGKTTIGENENSVTYDYFSNKNVTLTLTNHIELKEATTFDNLQIACTKTLTLGASGHKLTMGHQGDAESILVKDDRNKLNVGGGTITTFVSTPKLSTDVTIYAGTYGTVSGSNSSDNMGNETQYESVQLHIYGGTFDRIYVKGNLYDNFNNLTREPEAWIENAVVKEFIMPIECNYSFGAKEYRIHIGKNMKFVDNACVYTGVNRSNYGSANEKVKIDINGAGGEPYTIPAIASGRLSGVGSVAGSYASISVKNAEVEEFFGGSKNASDDARGVTTSLLLEENAVVDNLYFGGSNYSTGSVTVEVNSDTATIGTLSAGCKNASNTYSNESKLIFNGIGKKNAYKLNKNCSLKGFDSIILENQANVDITKAGPEIDAKTLDISQGSLTYLRSVLKFTGNLVGGNQESPATIYGSKAPNFTINGTVSGIMNIISKDEDPSSENHEVTGKFYYGANIRATHSDNHSEENFVCYQNDEDGTLQLRNMEFTVGTENSTDQWIKKNEEQEEGRHQVFVSEEEGADSNSGTMVSPVKTIKEAYLKAEELFKGDNAKTAIDIILLDDIVFDGTTPDNLSEGYKVTIKSKNSDEADKSRLTVNHTLEIPVDTTFDNMILVSALPSTSVEIYANGKNVVCSSQFETEAVSGHYPVIFGGTQDSTELKETKLQVFGGTWNQIFGGSKSAKVTESKLVVGNKVNTLNIGTTDENATGVYGGGLNGKTDKVNLIVNGGTYYRVFGGGMNNAASVGEVKVAFNSGKIVRLYGGGQNAQVQGNVNVAIGSGTDNITENAVITETYRGSGLYAGLSEEKTAQTDVYYNAIISENVQFAAGGYSGNLDQTKLVIHDGMINSDIYAGGWGEGTQGAYGNVRKKTEVIVQGGTIKGNIYGGGKQAVVNNAEGEAIATVDIKAGNITGNIYGGGNAAGVNCSTLNIESNVNGSVFGGSQNIQEKVLDVQKKSEVLLKNCEIYGNVFGGSDTSGKIQEKALVRVQEHVTVDNGVFGGGSKASLEICPEVTVADNAALTGNIFGGGKGELKSTNRLARTFFRIFTASDLIDANVPSTNVTINGTVNGDVFGGGEYATVGTTNEDGTSGATDGALQQAVSNVTINGTVNGKVYGGGKGEKDKDYAAVNGSTKVTLGTGGNIVADGNKENAITGIVFGGGQNAPVAGNTTVEVQDGTYSTIFGGNDVSGTIQGTARVTVNGGRTEHIYGAGRDAVYEGSGASVEINVSKQGTDSAANGGNTANTENTQNSSSAERTVSEAYGGGYGESATTNKAFVTIKNGNVTTAYAGGNAAATKNAEISVTGGTVDNVFGGGNAATITETSKITVNTPDNTKHVETVFAGNNQAAMAIKPTMDLQNGKIGTLYCGGNQGIMTYTSDANKGIQYSFDYPRIEIENVYAGCNNTNQDTDTSNVELTLVSGTYGTVYGGNNQNGTMAQTSVVVSASTDTATNNDNAKPLQVTTIYGGGNQANAKETKVTVKNGQIDTVYGGGNAATVTKSVNITTGSNETDSNVSSAQITITNLYCGNNEAEMNIAPTIDLQKGTITNFYGGGNKGTMTCENGISYTFDSPDLTVDTMYGGGNEAGVTTKAALLVKDGNYTTIYGGSNSKGTVQETEVTIAGDVGQEGNAGTGSLSGKIFGGGRGQETTVHTAVVYLQNGKIAGNVYGGSGFGTVETANVTAKESADNITSNNTQSSAKVQVLGDVFGAGYGVSSSVNKTDVTIDLNLSITDNANGDSDVQVTETAKDSTDKSGESQAKAEWTNGKKYTDGSYIAGNVFGGGDMGQVGKGYINNSTNTAVIEQDGTTSVTVSGGYIHGNVFGGGNGQPGGTDESGNAITEYTVYMGTVFGTSSVTMNGGYVNGSVFGCGQQSRTYAANDQDNDGAKDASFVILATDADTEADADGNAQKVVLIGGSIFGGGNKGNGTVQNASVATTYGDTHVTLRGKEQQNTPIYLLSNANGTAGGGVYGDGNLCLVSGKKYVTLQNFSCGARNNASLLKTFYSLQRADVVNLIGSRIVLKGAVDLVAENADDTLYSINRVSQLNLKKNSTIKVTKTVNLLGELTSDEQPNRQFIDRGNNTGNASVTGNEYTASGGHTPEEPLTDAEVKKYISAYETYATNGITDSTYSSINVVCVANGGYLEIKKSATEYGPVTGLFTLQLVNANPGEGGGFVYADIMGKKVTGSDGQEKNITGNFVCVTKQAENSSEYMFAYHNVGGKVTDDGKYEYYVWYLKGNRYNYDVDLTAYIGTTDTDFTKNISLALEPNQVFVLTELNQSKNVNGVDLDTMYQNTWDESSSTDKASDKFAVEVTLMKNEKSNTNGTGLVSTETSIGYLGYQTILDTDPNAAAKKDESGKLIWGIWRKTGTENGGWKFQACKGNNNSFQVTSGDALAEIGTDVVSAQLKFTLHKGTGMTTEFKNLPFEMKLVEVGKKNYEDALNKTDNSIETDSCIRLNTNLNLSAIRLVPTQAAYIGSGRMFAGVSSSSTVNITETSAFTAQFVTKYIPSAFNTGTQSKITETLTTGYSDIYLLDPNGVGYTIQEETDGSITIKNLTNTSNPAVKKYQITKKEGGGYQVSYFDAETSGNVMKDANGKQMVYECTVVTKNSGFTLPKGTMITLLASLDENDPTYWYYYCTDKKTEVPLSDFKKMNTSNENATNSDGITKSSESVYDTIFTTSSSRVTENMIFIFDFSKVSASDWQIISQNQQEGTVMLRHTYAGVPYDADIMDYVSTESQTNQDGSMSVKYTRETPKQTDTFKVSSDSDGIQEFTLTNTNGEDNPTYGQKECMRFNLNITPDTTVTNTQYEEREYAVILTLKKKSADSSSGTGTESDIAFPEGTTFTYKGEKLHAGKDNKYVVVPVKTVGTHEVEIESTLYGFDPGAYELAAKLYSTTEDGYYNSILVTGTNSQDTAAFTIRQDPTYALQVKEMSAEKKRREKNHFVTFGEAMDFQITAKANDSANGAGENFNNAPVKISLYKYMADGNNTYKKVAMDTVLEGSSELQLTSDTDTNVTTITTAAAEWKPKVITSATPGVYRLEFTWHDRTEYWDFKVLR